MEAACKRSPSGTHPLDAAAVWTALKQLPSKQATALQYVEDQLSLTLESKQKVQAPLAEAQDDLQDCLSEVQQEDGNIADAVKACLKAALQELTVCCSVANPEGDIVPAFATAPYKQMHLKLLHNNC